MSLAEHDVFGVSFIPQHIEAIREQFGIPAELEIAAIIPICYSAEYAKIPKQKPIPVQERKHYEQWKKL